MILRKIAGLVAVLGTAGALALTGAAQAGAATINGPFYTGAPNAESGYEIQSSTRFNDERATFCLPAGSTSSVGLGLQQDVNGGETTGLALVFVSSAPPPSTAGYWLLESGAAFVPSQPTGTPLISLVSISNEIATLGTPASTPLFTNATGGCAYLEIRQSTLHGVINLIEGPSETDAAVLADSFSGVHTTFFAPFIGVLRASSVLPVAAQQVNITRNGVTEPAGFNVGARAGTRVTFDFFPLDQTMATLNGGPPTVSPDNPVVLENHPGLPGVGSAFSVITGS